MKRVFSVLIASMFLASASLAADTKDPKSEKSDKAAVKSGTAKSEKSKTDKPSDPTTTVRGNCLEVTDPGATGFVGCFASLSNNNLKCSTIPEECRSLTGKCSTKAPVFKCTK